MQVHREALVPYSAAQMYALIQDIEQYHQFVPWCAESTVLSETVDKASQLSTVTARLTIRKGRLSQSFTTQNIGTLNQSVQMSLIEGPFSSLNGVWRLEPVEVATGEGCKIDLKIDFEFSNKVIALAFGPVFKTVTGSMVSAFLKRAVAIYGERHL